MDSLANGRSSHDFSVEFPTPRRIRRWSKQDRCMPCDRKIADDVIATYQAASEINRTMPLRHGNLVELPLRPGGEVLAAADLHGDRLNFERISELADLEHHPQRHLILQEVCHGGPTYPGGSGCMSHLLLEDCAAAVARFPGRVHYLLSNHELAELTDFAICKGNRMLNVAFRAGMCQLYGSSADEVRAAMAAFLKSCPLGVRMGERLLMTHSLPEKLDAPGDRFDWSIFDRPLRDEELLPGGSVFRLVWGRDFRPANAAIFAKKMNADILLNGHEPTSTGFDLPNPTQIVLDSCHEKGCYALLPLDRQLTHADVLSRVHSLHPAEAA
jgi:hypothetical protein